MSNQQNTNGVQELHSLFKSCLTILRNDAEQLVGDEGLHELSHFLILKLSETHIEKGYIDIYNLDYYNNGILKYGKEKFMEYLEYVKFSKLVEYVKIPEKESNIKNIFDEFLWKEVLSNHPKFKDIFESGKSSYIKESSTMKKIIIALSNIDFNNYEHDILGEAYESIFVDAVFGAGGNKKSELGQFFTPTNIKKFLVKLVDPKLKENGDIESVFDPASGTGGILNTIIKHYKQFEKKGQISSENLRKQLIKNIYGIEIKGKIYNLCSSNMLINTGEVLPNVICSDSVRKFHDIKVDNIVANPPFSITMKYDDLLSQLGSTEILNNYIPIRVGGKNSEILFLQMMIHCLNIEGRCATVMLDGEKMYGSSSGYDKAREYLMKSCDLHKVISCPPKSFTSTASKTCILFFTKKKERKDVAEITGPKRILKFCETHETKSVKFYNFNPDAEEVEEHYFIKEVSIHEIASNNYSLTHSEYGIKVKENKKEEGIKWTELNEICDFKNGKGIKKDKLIDGEYPVIGGGKKPFGNHNEYNRNENAILCSSSGAYSGYINKYPQKIWASDCFSIHSKNENILNEQYLFYYLINIQHKIYKLQNGAGIPHVYAKDLQKIIMPIIPIENQKKIVEFIKKLYENKLIMFKDTAYYYGNNEYDIFKLLLDGKYDLFEKLIEWQEQSVELSKQIEFFKIRQTRYIHLSSFENNIKTLSEICKIKIGGTPRRDNPNYWNDGKHIWVSVRELNDNIIMDSTEKISDLGVKESNVKLIPKDTILFSFKLSIGKIAISGCDLYTNEAIVGLIIQNNEDVLMKYLYYILKELNTFSSKGCIGGGSINKDSLSKIKLPVPSLEKQKEIVEYCEFNDKLIKQLENEIEQNKIQANIFISSIIKTSNAEPENEIIDVESLTNSIEEIESISINGDDETQSISNIVIEEVIPRVIKKLVKKIIKKNIIVENK